MIKAIIGILDNTLEIVEQTNKSIVLSDNSRWNKHTFHQNMQLVRTLRSMEVSKDPDVLAFNDHIREEKQRISKQLDEKLKSLFAEAKAKVESGVLPATDNNGNIIGDEGYEFVGTYTDWNEDEDGNAVQYETERTVYVAGVNDYIKWRKDAEKKAEIANDKLTDTGRKLYKDLAGLSILKTYQNDKGIKFIIQAYEDGGSRFCFDPYELMSNFHSSLSEMYRENKYGTMNGGWMKVIGNTVTLYAKSGDYGMYYDDEAISAAQLIFPDHKIESYAGMQWDEWNQHEDCCVECGNHNQDCFCDISF